MPPLTAAEGLAVVRPNLRRGRRELVLSELIGPGLAAAARKTTRRSRADYVVGWFSKGGPERSAATCRRADPDSQDHRVDSGGPPVASPARGRHISRQLGPGYGRPGVTVSDGR